MSENQITYETLLKAFEKVKTTERKLCSHVVHPHDAERGGWCICAQCFAPINIARRPRG